MKVCKVDLLTTAQSAPSYFDFFNFIYITYYDNDHHTYYDLKIY